MGYRRLDELEENDLLKLVFEFEHRRLQAVKTL